MSDILFNGQTLSTKDIFNLAYHTHTAGICPDSLQRNNQSRAVLDEIAIKNKPIYGVNTGFGELVYRFVDKQHETQLQENLVLSHAAGVGNYFDKPTCRAILASRINALCKGYSAVTETLLERLLLLLNSDIIPAIPEIGSLGASGDLGPLAHLAVVLIGQGYVYHNDEVVSTPRAFQIKNISPIKLLFKEGLALINGTSAMVGLGSLLIEKSITQIRQAEIISALVLENQRASTSPFQAQGHELAKPHQGQVDSAQNILNLFADSELVVSHDSICEEMVQSDQEVYIQKAYTLRCIPQIVGAIRDTLYHAQSVMNQELNSANDNPLFFDDIVFHGGNFHGQPVAFVLDYLAIGLTQLGVTSERRLNRLLNRYLSNGLPDFLVKGGDHGLSCGLAGAQYPATAMVAENRVLSTPASIQSIPSNGDNQDVVSMGLIAGRQANTILENNHYILAIELIAAAQAVDIAKQYNSLGTYGKMTYDFLRELTPLIDKDQFMRDHIEKVASSLSEGLLETKIAQKLALA